MKKYLYLLLLLIFSTLFNSCYRMRASNGGGQIGAVPQRIIRTKDIALLPGYKIEAVATGLTFPSAAAFDDAGHLYIIEAGYSYGEVWNEPKLLRIDTNGKTTVVVTGTRNGPWTGIAWYKDAFYIAEGGEAEGGRILRVTKEGQITPIVTGLPTMGDHHTNGPVIKDGYLYFGLGTATNSSVVGEDNFNFGWLKRYPDFHDVPCEDITLAGQNYETDNLLTDNKTDTATTGAYAPFGTPTTAGQIIKGKVPCSGSILRTPVSGGNVELVAWGFRNPFGFAVAPDSRLFITENGFDDRGSRPVWGAADVLWEVKQGTWYGWPDFNGGKPIQNDEEFKVPTVKHAVKPVLQKYPNTPPSPTAEFGVHSSANGIDFCNSDAFGYKGEAFVALFGDMAANTGKVLSPVGFKIVRVDIDKGVVRDFAVNKGKRNGPASWLRSGGLERPVSVKFDPAGIALYLVDFGILKMTQKGAEPQQGTGVIWKITKEGL